jgi:hypothetical protein
MEKWKVVSNHGSSANRSCERIDLLFVFLVSRENDARSSASLFDLSPDLDHAIQRPPLVRLTAYIQADEAGIRSETVRPEKMKRGGNIFRTDKQTEMWTQAVYVRRKRAQQMQHFVRLVYLSRNVHRVGKVHLIPMVVEPDPHRDMQRMAQNSGRLDVLGAKKQIERHCAQYRQHPSVVALFLAVFQNEKLIDIRAVLEEIRRVRSRQKADPMVRKTPSQMVKERGRDHQFSDAVVPHDENFPPGAGTRQAGRMPEDG